VIEGQQSQGSKDRDKSSFLRIIRLPSRTTRPLGSPSSTARSSLDGRAITRLRTWTKRPFCSFTPKNSLTEFH
jgi:hypothetical protein